MSTTASRTALDGAPIKRVTIYDGGGNPITPTNPIPFTPSVTALVGASPNATVVTASSGAAVPSNGLRKGLTLVNLGASGNVSLGIGTTNAAILNSGITLTNNGGSFSMDEFSFTTGAINAIAAASGARLAWQEWTSS